MASITINFTSAMATRISLGMQEALNLENPATLEDVKQYLISDLRAVVSSAEKRIARRAMAQIDEVDIT